MSEVAYSGVLQIPVCIGSVAVPLPDVKLQSNIQGSALIVAQGDETKSAGAPTRRGGTGAAVASHRCTHRRYCYLRDGAALSQDGFYRWLLHRTRTSAALIAQPNTVAVVSGDAAQELPRREAAAAPCSLKRRRSGAKEAANMAAPNIAAGVGKCADGEVGTELAVSSPSLLYSMIDHVVFTLPKGFASTRRVLREAPFVIADDTWARHLVEVQIFFHSELGIAPVTLGHHVLLDHLAEVPPRLQARQFGQPKPPSFLALPPAGTHPTADLEWLVVVSERKDSVRLMHPSLLVLTFVRRVLAKANAPVMRALWRYYIEQATPPGQGAFDEDARPATVLSCYGAPEMIDSAWQLPYEPFIERHAQNRAMRARETLRTVLAALCTEQDDLWVKNDAAVEGVRTTVGELHARLDAMRATCMRLAGDTM